MGRQAITLDEQIDLLRSRGMTINDEEKAKEVLLDVGYYRLGFYWFPFETTYPNKRNRTHQFTDNANFDVAVKLYYFDFKLRNILLYYINRIEINFRNYLTYTVSNFYNTNSQWFSDNSIVNPNFTATFDDTVYNSNFKKNSVIKQHHRTYSDKYAPAWKTLEFMTLGSVINLYKALNDNSLRIRISQHYGIRYTQIFDNYIEIIRNVRNYCAHGNVLFDFVPFQYIRRGPANISGKKNFSNLYGSIAVILYMLKQVSINRYNDMVTELINLVNHYSKTPEVKQIIENISGISSETLKNTTF